MCSKQGPVPRGFFNASAGTPSCRKEYCRQEWVHNGACKSLETHGKPWATPPVLEFRCPERSTPAVARMPCLAESFPPYDCTANWKKEIADGLLYCGEVGGGVREV